MNCPTIEEHPAEVTKEEKIRSLAVAIHAAFDGPAGSNHELNCYDCATWPDENTPGYSPAPKDDCWKIAVEVLNALGG